MRPGLVTEKRVSCLRIETGPTLMWNPPSASMAKSVVSVDVTTGGGISVLDGAREAHPPDYDPLPAVRIAKSGPAVEALRNEWQWWYQNPNSDIDIYSMQNRHWAEVLSPYVMAVYRGGRPDCILVGRLERIRVRVNFGGVRVFLPEARIIRFIRDGFLGDRSDFNSHLLVQGITKALREGEADVAEFTSIRLDSPLCRTATRLPEGLSRDYFPAQVVHRSLLLPGTFEEFLKDLPRKKRHNLRSHGKRISGDFPGQVQIRCLGRDLELEHFIRDCETIAGRTYQRTLGTGFVANSATREQLQIEAGKGRLRGYVLRVAGKPSAFLIASQHQGTLYASFMGYDPQYSKYSPGSFLLMHCIEDCLKPRGNEKTSVLDLGAGNHRYKRDVCNQEWQEATVDIFAPTLKGAELNLLRMILVFVAYLGKTFVADSTFRDTIVRAWRHVVSIRRRHTIESANAAD
jgi:GNAT acetyltransferase-like protein